MKRVFAALLLAAAVVATSAACNLETPEEKYKRECAEQGGTTRSNYESDGEQVLYCVLPGESFNPVQDD